RRLSASSFRGGVATLRGSQDVARRTASTFPAGHHAFDALLLPAARGHCAACEGGTSQEAALPALTRRRAPCFDAEPAASPSSRCSCHSPPPRTGVDVTRCSGASVTASST